MNAIEIAVAFLKDREACRLSAYWDTVGKVWTIGYGATGPNVTADSIWTQTQADTDLTARVENLATQVQHIFVGTVLDAYQIAALVSFAYNLGVGTLERAAQLQQYVRLGDWNGVVANFLVYSHAGGVQKRGLLKRRLYEAALFLEG